MNTDIRISYSFRNHRKRAKFEGLVGPRGTGYLLNLWLTAAQQRPTGHLKDWDAQDIALAAGYKGDPKKFVESLLQCKFIDLDADGYQLHEWSTHQPWCTGAEHRSEMARKAALIRWDATTSTSKLQRTPEGQKDNPGVKSMQSACDPHAERNAPSPSPSPSPYPIPSLKNTIQQRVLASLLGEACSSVSKIADSVQLPKERVSIALTQAKKRGLVSNVRRGLWAAASLSVPSIHSKKKGVK